jgi:hypothetical protein
VVGVRVGLGEGDEGDGRAVGPVACDRRLQPRTRPAA